MLKHHPSMIASASLFLAIKINFKHQGINAPNRVWTPILQKHTKFNEQQLRPCAKDLCNLL